MSFDRGMHLFDGYCFLPRTVQHPEERRQRYCFRPKLNSASPINDEIDPVSGLEMELPPNFDRDGDLTFARDGGLWHIPYLS